ncbi:XtrA/YqaO family protein [Bacillus sp. 03113]|uniref:XtrA/YqaO family protein n=1 Tax=Bacillus sp. 03113 TaxID=2578211 RepID=UPI0011417908|nr:XtrA/YqaO family protein [Bacillus sp. 03113]
MKKVNQVVNHEESIAQNIESDKVVILVLDGLQGKVTKCVAPEHGLSVIETVKGKGAKFKTIEENFLL